MPVLGSVVTYVASLTPKFGDCTAAGKNTHGGMHLSPNEHPVECGSEPDSADIVDHEVSDVVTSGCDRGGCVVSVAHPEMSINLSS